MLIALIKALTSPMYFPEEIYLELQLFDFIKYKHTQISIECYEFKILNQKFEIVN